MSRSMKDLFGDDLYEPSYPDRPGYRDRETSKEAADSMVPTADSLRALVLGLLAKRWCTVHEAADILELSVPSIQPRFSELLKKDLIEWTGERRRNARSTRNAKEWRLTKRGEACLR